MTSKTMNALSLSKSDGTVECAIVDLVGVGIIRILIRALFLPELDYFFLQNIMDFHLSLIHI